jgi:hypothetical protein
MGGELMPLPDQKPAPLLLVQVNCLMVASALSRSGAWTVPRCSPLLRMMRTRQLRRLASEGGVSFWRSSCARAGSLERYMP